MKKNIKTSKNNFKIWIKPNLFYPRSGSALILTMFILAGMLLVAISSSYVVTLGIKAGGIQAQSTRAYFIAESGIEKFLWELRANGHSYLDDDLYYEESSVPAFVRDLVPEQATGVSRKFEVLRKGERLYQSIGEFGNTKRAVEIEF
ncbi:pilus assembly PilX N-terminal domain-containing protein [Patescibacteria group bacterium]|nr:pilus assembly PilX N-terminal domain-containing protein [Patescibacteria group bacterium]